MEKVLHTSRFRNQRSADDVVTFNLRLSKPSVEFLDAFASGTVTKLSRNQAIELIVHASREAVEACAESGDQPIPKVIYDVGLAFLMTLGLISLPPGQTRVEELVSELETMGFTVKLEWAGKAKGTNEPVNE